MPALTKLVLFIISFYMKISTQKLLYRPIFHFLLLLNNTHIKTIRYMIERKLLVIIAMLWCIRHWWQRSADRCIVGRIATFNNI